MKKVVIILVSALLVSVGMFGQEKITISLQKEQTECESKFAALKQELENCRSELLNDTSKKDAKRWDAFRTKIDSVSILILSCNEVSNEKIKSFQEEADKLYSAFIDKKTALEKLKEEDKNKLAAYLYGKIDSLLTRQDTLQILTRAHNDTIGTLKNLRTDYGKLLTAHKDTCLLLSAYLKKDKIFNTGIAIGANIERDSVGKSHTTGMLSAVFSFKLPWFQIMDDNYKKAYTKGDVYYSPIFRPRILVNIPLINVDDGGWANLFNSKTALGLGVSFDVGKSITNEIGVSLFYIVNFPATNEGKISHYIGLYIPLV